MNVQDKCFKKFKNKDGITGEMMIYFKIKDKQYGQTYHVKDYRLIEKCIGYNVNRQGRVTEVNPLGLNVVLKFENNK